MVNDENTGLTDQEIWYQNHFLIRIALVVHSFIHSVIICLYWCAENLEDRHSREYRVNSRYKSAIPRKTSAIHIQKNLSFCCVKCTGFYYIQCCATISPCPCSFDEIKYIYKIIGDACKAMCLQVKQYCIVWNHKCQWYAGRMELSINQRTLSKSG